MRITRPSIRSVTLRVSAVALMVALALGMFTAGSVQAAPQHSVVSTSSVNLSHQYDYSMTFKSPHLNVCITFRVYGTFKYTVTFYPRSRYWSNQKLTNPTLSAYVYGYNRGLCNTHRALTSISLGQNWAGYGCSFNPSLSVSIPWGIAFGGWPTCGSRNQAEHDSSYGHGAGYTQYNSGSPTAFGNYSNVAVYPPCYGVYVDATAYESTLSDSYTSNPREVCLPA